ncbi:MAG: hypothetical protein ACI8ZM_003728 [Crocinitomix sp.]|jgi:hypothetical protein
MKNLFFILTFICATAMISCSEQVDDNTGDISTTEDSGIDGCEMIEPNQADCDKSNCDKKCDMADCDKSKCDKNKGCEKSNCEKYGCDKAEGCTAECMAECLENCENPDKCMKMWEKDSTDAACDGAE